MSLLRASHPFTLSRSPTFFLIRALSSEAPALDSAGPPNTYFKITLRRSAISLEQRYKRTLVAMGLKRRLQTVYHKHSPVMAGKILRVKELVEVENVPESAVRTAAEQRAERKATRGYEVVSDVKSRTF